MMPDFRVLGYSGGQSRWAFVCDGTVFLWMGQGSASGFVLIAGTDVGNVSVVSPPPASLGEHDMFDVRVRVTDVNGLPLANRFVIGHLVEQAGLTVSKLAPQSDIVMNRFYKKLLDPIGYTDADGYADMSMRFSYSAQAGRYSIKFACEAVQSESVSIMVCNKK